MSGAGPKNAFYNGPGIPTNFCIQPAVPLSVQDLFAGVVKPLLQA